MDVARSPQNPLRAITLACARTRRCAVAGVITALAAAPVAAQAQEPSAREPSVRAGHSIGIFHNIDFAAATGYQVGSPMRIEVFRGPHRIGSAHGPAAGTAEGSGLEVNHGPEGAAVQGDCWDTLTPDIRPGDRIVVSGDGGQDTVFVDNIVIDEIEPGTTAGDENVYVRGVARYANGTPIPVAALDSGEVRTDGGRTRAVPTQPVKRIAGTEDRWEAVYEAPGYGAVRGIATKDSILAGDHAMGYGHPVIPPPPVIQLFEGAESPGPALGCEASPAAPANAIGAFDDQAINLTSGALEVSGVAGPAVTAVGAILSTATRTVTALPENVSLTTEPGGQAWTATFTRDQLLALDDGEITARASFEGAGADAVTHARTIVKDLQAPVAPVADPPPGTYTGRQLIRLSRGPDEMVHFTRDGSEPTAQSTTTSGFLGITSSQTLKVIAIDAAGNSSPVASFEYVITDPPADDAVAPQQAAATSPAAGPLAPPAAPPPAIAAPLPVAGSSLQPLKLSALFVNPRIGRDRVRREGLRLRMRVPGKAQVVRIRIYRRTKKGKAKGRELIWSGFRAPDRAGLFRVRLNDRKLRRKLRPARYEIEATPGTARNKLGSPSRAAFRVSRSR